MLKVIFSLFLVVILFTIVVVLYALSIVFANDILLWLAFIISPMAFMALYDYRKEVERVWSNPWV